MNSLISGTYAGAGSFSCSQCGYGLTLSGTDSLSDCPMCGGHDYVRASLFGTERTSTERISTASGETVGGELVQGTSPEQDALLARAREQLGDAGEYLIFEEGGESRTVALTREWTRIGRSLAADVRFDDPTVSRRHALIVRQPDGVRLLDDRSLNGVFVNGARVEGKALQDGDEIIVGRYRLTFVRVGAEAAVASGESSLRTAG